MRRRILRPLASCLLLLLASVSAKAQPGSIVAVHEGVPQDIFATPPTMDLIATQPGAHPGKIWIRSAEDGLHVWGKIQSEDNGLHWPEEKSVILASDHIEVWLADSTKVDMPPVGWGNQFGKQELAGIKDCGDKNDGNTGDLASGVKNCERWYNEQVEYRKQFERLFARQWLASTGARSPRRLIFEDFATTAYASLKAGFFDDELPADQEPKSNDGVASEITPESAKRETKHDAAGNPYDVGIITGYNFQIFIPYSAFPPAKQLELRDIWLMVDVFSAAPEGKKMGPYATTAASRKWGEPATFNHLRLDAPRSYSITPCAANPVEQDMYGDAYPAWFFPVAGKNPLYLSTVFDIQNPAGGYMYDPGGVSPQFAKNEHFWKQLPDKAYVCGPRLTYRNGPVAKPTNFGVRKQYFETKTLPDGWRLVRSGPDMSTQSPFGSGQCGACPVVDFDIYAVSPAGEITQALEINHEFAAMESSADGGDLAIAPDWSRVTFYKKFVTYIGNGKGGEKDNWTAESYCLEGHAYKECGKEDNAKPPKPANVPEVSGDSQD